MGSNRLTKYLASLAGLLAVALSCQVSRGSGFSSGLSFPLLGSNGPHAMGQIPRFGQCRVDGTIDRKLQ